ncbi:MULTISPECIES: DUF2510 domain-containing protein [unclassified Microbacterium]|uniref:DUF2510 domain-containing protein n=1 Tax=unclassified Microbacterium TaxID=2609290 RepID=UPI002468F471|nr:MULTISPECIES: DUF2510 domain-containing protein [unclassified Microbacterium]MDH5132875.1 DUF2510 domain-containing protein [Microbacterium sp. RD10]MDH5136408.1 DUF2510 domain-containing protein [Microbacterium sp. RD11]MDH5145126.1 DUF2510 domain-containing protein [Microbacterium sp. RD12]MDH5154797.1 DUF2510 domain-containing protein [Microbacterium sp. RD06]MDH5164941.1 DUF2510 domain-containing protein [Microbacterium sp. RD02]
MSSMAQVAPGWYDDGSGRQRWWDGSTWTDHYADARKIDSAQQAALLNAEVARYAAGGWMVQSATPNQVVLSKVKRMGWFWNLILVLLTAGLWLIFVIYRALNRKSESMILTIDDYGRIHRQQA